MEIMKSHVIINRVIRHEKKLDRSVPEENE